MLSLEDAEGEALALYESVGADPSEPPGPHALAHALLGEGGIRYGRHGLAGDARLSRAERTIMVRPGLSLEREVWAVAHELGEWICAGRFREDPEAAANLVAACLIMPRVAFLEAARATERDVAALATAFRVTPTAAALRLAEVDGTPTVVVSRSWAWVRGEDFGWPQTLDGIRRLAKCTPPTGLELEREQLRDNRVVVRAKR